MYDHSLHMSGGAHSGLAARPAVNTEQLASWLSGGYPGGDRALAAEARRVMHDKVGPNVHMRGLLEFSNICSRGCYYCGIRRHEKKDGKAGYSTVQRFELSEDEVLLAAQFCVDSGFGSITLQAGERQDRQFISFVERILRRIKQQSTSSALPHGLGITLCVGEQSKESYERFFAAGAHRYLLRIETSNPDLYRRLHPEDQSFDKRVRALQDLKEIGYQVGTGVMIGLPTQSVEDLAEDIKFYQEIDADMIGMGPYLEAGGSAQKTMQSLGLLQESAPKDRLRLSLRMIAATRIALEDVNIAAATALQAISPTGREAGLNFGANVMMPLVTPARQREKYQLYGGKPCIDEHSQACGSCIPKRAARVKRPVTVNAWGDAPHAFPHHANKIIPNPLPRRHII